MSVVRCLVRVPAERPVPSTVPDRGHGRADLRRVQQETGRTYLILSPNGVPKRPPP
ncbi:hypothetical protein DACRYDRAFT_21344 [Dacryopinax primogenitus]|uniref:Uncharacterized protein n=1 Tax=Dacryopinax primogenitus (strain DJM 731) TaxID=1858805 RepID=M5G2P8_DACPD|nr:uncharacterized protein DACRYDRAFT_21344 [Dacryopinax primogenitus]EJU02969.1 hypothetical protein DACRYDRAFT_21344 [Dacryopinax primogenitus]